MKPAEGICTGCSAIGVHLFGSPPRCAICHAAVAAIGLADKEPGSRSVFRRWVHTGKER